MPWWRAGLAGLAVVLIVALAVVVIPRLNRDGQSGAEPPTVPASPTSPAAPAEDAVFPAFYPVTTLADAKRLQDSVDNGHQPLTLLPKEVARQFARDYIGWQRVELGTEKKSGSAAEGWKATIELRPYVGEDKPPSALGARHIVELIGLAGAKEPTWFVTGIASDDIELEADDPPVRATSPLAIKGKGVGFEGTITTEIRDDAGTVLHPRPGAKPGTEGFVQGGAMAPEPFVGTLEFNKPKTPGGVLILQDSPVADGEPAHACTIVRLSFAP